jgi:hypothetical protein
MRAIAFWKTIAMDRTEFLDRLLTLLIAHDIRFCVVGGQAVNAYVEPVVSLDLDLAIAVAQIEQTESLLRQTFMVERFPHSVNVSDAGSDLRVQLQSDPRYGEFVERASVREVLGLRLPVAQLEDVLRGKVWAAMDSARRASKRQKDLADIARLLEAYPYLRAHVPEELLAKLL